MNQKLTTFEELFQTGLEYIYDAEKKLTQALPKMAEAASSPQLRDAFQQHLQETKNHVQRIEQICSKLNIRLENKSNSVVEAMIHEAEGMIRTIDASALRDASLIIAGNQVEHFEIGSYGSLRSFAELLGYQQIISLLDQTLQEEKNADRKLTEVGETSVNQKAAQMRGQTTR